MNVKVSDVIARFLAEKQIRHVFGIIGAGNAHIFDSVYRTGATEIICVHHEQAACMAAQTYYRTCGVITASLVTTGAGSSNAVTGVLSAWMDSIPGLIISGNENSKFTTDENPLRIYGVQGFDSPAMVKKMTKYASRVMDPTRVLYELEKANYIAESGRPGPCWVDVPMNIQSSLVDESQLRKFSPAAEQAELQSLTVKPAASAQSVAKTLELLKSAKRPLLWLGHGIRMGGAAARVSEFLESVRIPALISWSGIDMVDSNHPLVYGRAGVYGQRCANFILQNCDFLLTIGTRLAIPQIGYDITELARSAKIAVVDIDSAELKKYEARYEHTVCADAGSFMTELKNALKGERLNAPADWMMQCENYRKAFPWVGPEHTDEGGFINSYPFMDRLNSHLKKDQIIVTDMGTALLSGHQVLRVKPPQRLMTSLGLGEMGYGLPGAIGASFARNRGEVMCLNCDGGMMMNLQEIQTMVHYKLPIKLIIFNNDGYLMIKHTQNALFNGRHVAVATDNGVSCPNFSALAQGFGIPSWQIRTWEDFDNVMPQVQAASGPVICEVFTHPEQPLVPKLSLAVQTDGTLISPPLEDLSPLLPRKTLEKHMLIGVHPKSTKLQA